MTNQQYAIFLPALVQIALVIWLYGLLAIRKSKALKEGAVNHERRALYEDAWPEAVIKVNNNIRNQSELPALFYALTLILYVTNNVSAVTLALAWTFVLSRIAHAYIHVGNNVVAIRKPVFMVGAIVLIVLSFIATIGIVIQ